MYTFLKGCLKIKPQTVWASLTVQSRSAAIALESLCGSAQRVVVLLLLKKYQNAASNADAKDSLAFQVQNPFMMIERIDLGRFEL
jgi:hypothetical protein